MADFRFLHCADLHLDSPLRGLQADPDAPADAIRGATRRAFANLVDYALTEGIDFVVAAGDLYDGDWQDWRTGRFLIDQVRRLTQADIPFVAIRGNHDAENVMTRRLELRGDSARLLDHRKPETFYLPGRSVAIHGRSFPARAVTENIALTYPAPDPECFNIGLLHTSIDGREGHDNYAPCSVEQLRDHGYDYWALGHVHQREILSRDPWIVFPGNLQGRHINEPGEKGASLVTVTGGKVSDVRHVTFDAVQWTRISIAIAVDADEDAALAQVRSALAAAYEKADGRLLAARVLVSGACVAHEAFSRDLGSAREKIRAEALNVAEHGAIWMEAVEIATTAPAGGTIPRDRADAIGQLIRALEAVTEDEVIPEIQQYAAAMLDKAAPLRLALGEGHAAANEVFTRELVRRARDLLLGSILE